MRILPLLFVAACSSAAAAPVPPTPDDDGNKKVTTVDAGPDVVPVPAPTPDAMGTIEIGLDAPNVYTGFLETIVTVDGVVKSDDNEVNTGNALLPKSRTIEAKDGVLVELRVLVRTSSDSAPVITRTARAHVVGNAKKLLYVRLEDKCSAYSFNSGPAPTCTTPETCIGGVCTADLADPLPDFYDAWATEPPSSCGTGAPTLEIGKGATAFAPLAANETVEVQCGGQGGHHIWLSLQMTGLDQYSTVTSISGTNGTTNVDLTAYADPYAHIGTGCAVVGLRFQIDGAHPLTDFLGKPFDVAVSLKDRLNHTITATKHVNIGTNPCQ